MKNTVILLSACILMSQTGCITLFSPKKQKVNFSTSEPGAKINLDGKEIGDENKTLVLEKDMSIRDLTITKDGYKTKTDAVFQTRFNHLIWLDVALIPVFVGYVGLIIDGAGSKWKAFEKNYDYDNLQKLPQKQKDQRYLFVNSTSVEVKKGDQIGNYYTKYKNFIKKKDPIIINADDDVSYANTTFTHDLNSLLVDYGYTDTTNSVIPDNLNSLFLELDILSYDVTMVNVRNNGGDKFITQLTLELDWTFQDSYGTEVYSTQTKQTSDLFGANKEDLYVVIKDALDYSLLEVLSDEKVSEQLYINEEESNPTEKLEVLELTNSFSADQSLNSTVKSSVTIKTDKGHGSGFVISDNGHIVSCYHVTAGKKSLKVIFEDGEEYDAEVIRHDPKLDLVLLKTERTDINPIKISANKEIDLGKEVYAIGTPESIELGQTISKGIISGKRNANENTYIQTDVSINSGNSGGAMVTKEGEVIGVVNAKLKGIGVEGIGFAIPSYYIMERLKISIK